MKLREGRLRRRRASLSQGVYRLCGNLIAGRSYFSERFRDLRWNTCSFCRGHKSAQQFLVLNADKSVLHKPANLGPHLVCRRAGYLGRSVTGYLAGGLLKLVAADQHGRCGQKHE